MPIARGCPLAVYALMIDCWHPEAKKRPTFDYIRTRLKAIRVWRTLSYCPACLASH